MDKRDSYSQEKLVTLYEKRRFNGKSGEFVNQKELDIVYQFIKKNIKNELVILDSPCGTGRLTNFLKRKGIRVIGLDYSPAMLERSRNTGDIQLIRGDMFEMPMKTNSLDCIVSLRFLFHYRNIKPMFYQIKRILKEEGILIFDTFNWSPRANFLLQDKRIYIHSRRKIKGIIQTSGMQVVDEYHCFLVSPMLYTLFPLPIVRSMEFLEKKVPPWLLARSFWCVKKKKEKNADHQRG
jgi:SAM-dependent methyltransferase